MKSFLLYIWQLPQNLAGLLVLLITKANKNLYYGVYTWKYLSGVCLGNYIFLYKVVPSIDVKHERGHQKQSKYLGWFYLVIIGLPSLIGNLIYRVHPFDYYNQPWEKWADKLGGVKR